MESTKALVEIYNYANNAKYLSIKGKIFFVNCEFYN